MQREHERKLCTNKPTNKLTKDQKNLTSQPNNNQTNKILFQSVVNKHKLYFILVFLFF